MQSIIKTSKQIGVLTIALTLAFVANFAYGQWADPTTAPTGGNVAAPLNVGSTLQHKQGQLLANEFHSDRYCNAAGTDCVSPAALAAGPSAGVNGIQTGSVLQSSMQTTEYIWVPFVTPYATPPQVVVIPTGYIFTNGCSNSPWLQFFVAAQGVTQYGFVALLSGRGTCGGGVDDVQTLTWIAF